MIVLKYIMKNQENKKTIIFLAPSPPPYMGPSLATEIILSSSFIKHFNVIHIDTVDKRPLSNLAKIDLTNIGLALKQYSLLLWNLIMSDTELVYILISQTTIGFLRDFPFILITKLLRRKIVLHLRGADFKKFYNNSNICMKLLVKETFRRLDRMIVLCDLMRKYFIKFIPEGKISVVQNGLDVSFTGKKKGTARKFTILFMSSLRESKGIWETLSSINKVKNYKKEIRFVFAGMWRLEQDRIRCEKYIKKENLSDFIQFNKFVLGEEKFRLLQEADVFVLPSYSEGHPWVLVEAMAAGLPLISTNVGCVSESVLDCDNGFIIPKKDAAALADKIIYFIDNPEERDRMAKRSRVLYEQKFTEKHFIKNMVQCIKSTL